LTRPGPQAVLLDFGGVLWDMRWDVARALEGRYALPPGTLFETLYRIDAWREVERGRGDPEAWRAAAHAALVRRAGRALPPLHHWWRQAQRPLEANVALVHRLRGRVRLAVVSNADRTLRSRLADGLGILHLFDTLVCSAEVGVAKPDPAIYTLAAVRLGVRPEACVFVDDHEANVCAARAVGMHAVLYRVDRGDDLERLLADAGVPTGPAVPQGGGRCDSDCSPA
jgi:putative hydrolase of the HAD superfamily